MNWLDNLSKEVKMLVAAIACLVTFGGFLVGLHNYMERYALAEELKQTNKRLDQKIMSDQLNNVQQRIWTLEDRYKGKKMESSVSEEYRVLQEQKKQLNDELQKKK